MEKAGQVVFGKGHGGVRAICHCLYAIVHLSPDTHTKFAFSGKQSRERTQAALCIPSATSPLGKKMNKLVLQVIILARCSLVVQCVGMAHNAVSR